MTRSATEEIPPKENESCQLAHRVGAGIVSMGTRIVNAKVGLIVTIVLGTIELAVTAYGIDDSICRWDPLSQTGSRYAASGRTDNPARRRRAHEEYDE